MANYFIKLLAKKEVAEKTTAFFFEKPKGFKFAAGQHTVIDLIRSKYKDEKGLIRPFSIASSPNENFVMIAARIRDSAFKNTLKEMKLGTKVKIEKPHSHGDSDLILPKDSKRPVVFLAGGVGITPFWSMIKNFSNRKITLFYSNRRKKDAAFLEEIKFLQDKNFKLVTTMTKEGGNYINPKIIKSNLKDWKKATYYIAGPPGFVQSMADMLSKMKLKPEQIKTENFSGY